MINPNLSFQFKSLSYTNDPDEFKLYRAALEWDLIDPIIIENRDDLKSEKRWKDKIEPYQHQVKNLITFCRRLPVTLLADDVGLGKTISAGLVASELISRGRLNKILIVCPKILREQWQEELKTKFGIPSVVVTGRGLVDANLPDDIGAVITTYRSATLHLDKIKEAGFDMLILDEAHKLRNLYGTDSAPQVATTFKKALADRMFKYVLMLTATPIQNRLWDLYSLVDLLTVARGHENPFGTPGIFARKFIEDNRTQARRLNPDMQDEFRSIVYGYMSRVRRGDADLHFPTREVQLHSVLPTSEELELITVIANSIEGMDKLTQIGILKTLVSSPEALVIQLKGMASRKTAPESLFLEVKKIAKRIPLTAKLQGLGALIDRLRAERPDDWRVVVFTTRIETQTSIQTYLLNQGIAVGIINGQTGKVNQDTLAKFKSEIPEINVIVSTEAGSEGVNLQAANVLVNYDLPWNPMIVEQRIGRIQRLGSKHEKVCIFNIVLKGTFEEYIVGRLVEKLQMAASAIGDIESLLQASGMDDGEEDEPTGFEEKILQLVLDSLKGKDVEAATRRTAKSISDAKIQLEDEEKNINSLLGGMDDVDDNGPRCPKLPSAIQSMDAQSFVLDGLKKLGAKISAQKAGSYLSKLNGKEELVYISNDEFNPSSEGLFSGLPRTLYVPGSPAFERLVNKLTSLGLHRIVDADEAILKKSEDLAKSWVKTFEAKYEKFEIKTAKICFSGTALVRARTTVAHDSYERLVEILCTPNEYSKIIRNPTDPIELSTVDDLSIVGITSSLLIEKAKIDPGVAEFGRFYYERLAHELKSAGNDPRKRKKIQDDFTSRLEFSLVGLEGFTRRELDIVVTYCFEGGFDYESKLAILPSANEIIHFPILETCEKSSITAPVDCLSKCSISGLRVMQHLLVKSEISNRLALPEYMVICSVSGKKILSDEVEKSDVTGNLVTPDLMKKSTLSGKRAESALFDECDFTGAELLKTELVISHVSSKKFRMDEELISAVSGKKGHKSEFIFCADTRKPLLESEAEKCEVTGKIVFPGILEECTVTGKKVMPSELEKSAVSGHKALKKFFVTSSISSAKFLEEEGIKSITGNSCVPLEAKVCEWSGRKSHPEDLKNCELTGLLVYLEYLITKNYMYRHESLNNMLVGTSRKSDKNDLWSTIVGSTLPVLGNGKHTIEAAELSPDGNKLALCMEIKTLLGFKVRHYGFIFSIKDNLIVGKIAKGKREENGWTVI